MTALVTGGAGFIGANFIFYWLRTHPGDRVVCVDKLTYAGNLSVLKAALENPAFRFVKADICDREAMDRLPKRERHIIDLRFFEGKTQTEVAEEIHISQAQVSRLEKNALKSMRNYLN